MQEAAMREAGHVNTFVKQFNQPFRLPIPSWDTVSPYHPGGQMGLHIGLFLAALGVISLSLCSVNFLNLKEKLVFWNFLSEMTMTN
jgi:hypothetical protein